MLFARSIVRGLYLQSQNPRYLNVFQAAHIKSCPAHYQRFNYTSKMDAQTRQEEMISFWFNRDPMEWFFPPEGFDDEIRTKFSDLIKDARSGALDDWGKDAKGSLCLVLLLDQMPRNIFRGSGESFSSDSKALEVASRAVAQRFDQELGQISKVRQSILYLPFIHAENLVAQIAAVSLYKNLELSSEVGSEEREYFARGEEFSRRHLNCVAKLGRFPKRNEPLGRETTEEEVSFLKENPAGF